MKNGSNGNGKHNPARDAKMRASQETYLEALVLTGGAVGRACRVAKVERGAPARWRAEAEFTAAEEDAMIRAARVAKEIRADAASLAKDRIIELLEDDAWCRDPANNKALVGLACYATKNCPIDPWTDRREVEHSGGVTFAEALAMTRPDRMKAE